MVMIFPLLFVFLCGCFNQAGSLVLTSSHVTATDREMFTLICISNANGGQDRQWSRDGTLPVFTTTQGSPSLVIVNPDVYNRYLSGRVNVICDTIQHNVTLRINSTIDNGSAWQCVDNQISQRSNNVTIYVTVDQATVPTTTYATSVTTTTTTDVTSSRSADVVSETSTSTTSNWHNTPSTTATTTSNNTTTTGRPISSSGSTNTTNTNTNAAGVSTGQSDTIAIAAGAAGGAVAVIAVVIVAAVCIRKKRRSVEDNVRDKSRRDRNPSRSVEMLIESGLNGEDEKVMMDNIIYTSSSEVVPAEYSIQGHNQADKVMQDNILYTGSSDIAPADYSTEVPNPVAKDVNTEVKKVKTNADEHELTDMYAKPHKGRKETPIGDMYAQVNKVKSREGTSENTEDMYAKPQKDKRNVKSNADTD
ncbi:uncharacterized protein [Haliotis asinina]|uniref:uncharacterized protein isoform X1 n=1 Tax=Haliotis asinina TaxID=109174 RepID=UPI003532353B